MSAKNNGTLDSSVDDGSTLEVRWTQGFTSSKVEFLDEITVCYPCGSYIIFLNLETKTRNLLQSPGQGIGVFTANGHCKTLAFSEQKLFPSIFVYEYPELKLRCELKGPVKVAYTALTISNTAPYVASCSSLPDFTITVWDLESGMSICNSQLPEEDATAVLFNPVNWLQICVASATSLTVWNIEKMHDQHLIKSSVIDLPAIDGSVIEKEDNIYIPTGKSTYYGPKMPRWAVAGLIGGSVDILPPKQVKPRLCPNAICWSMSSDLYVGTKEGSVLFVNTESLLVSILYTQDGHFQNWALLSKGVFVTEHDSLLQILEIKENHVEIVETLNVKDPISSLSFSPDHETLLVCSTTGRIYKYNTWLQNEEKVLDVLCGDFIAAVPVYTKRNFCVSVRESGELQIWSVENGDCIASIALQEKVTSMASCSTAQYVAVGTETGHVLFVDLTRTQKPRLVHSVHLYRVPVEHLAFDHGANCLITGSSESHIFFLDARPSETFKVIGYTDVMGATVSLSTQYQKETKQVDVVVLCNNEEIRTDNKHKQGNLVMKLSVYTKILDTKNCADPYGRLQKHVLQKCVYEVPCLLSSCVLGISTIFGYCHQKKVLQRFKLTQNTVELNPEKEVEGHQLGPVVLHLSPNGSCLASIGRDGMLCIYDIATLETYVKKQCHSWWLGGIRSVSFTPDSKTVITTGLQDGSLVCSLLRLKIDAASQAEFDNLLEGKPSKENPILRNMAELEPPSQTPSEKSDQDQVTTLSSSTWLDNRRNAVLKEESKQFAETKERLQMSKEKLQETVQAMMKENEMLPEAKKLMNQEFNLDMKEHQRLQALGEEKVSRVREEIELDNLAKCYQRDILRKKYWDPMEVKENCIQAFHSEYKVNNFPIKKRPAKELEELNRVMAIRRSEQANHKPEVACSAFTGSLSAHYGGSTKQLYSQFHLHTKDQKLNQIILLQDIMYNVKVAFNAEFEALRKRKQQVISRIKDKNKHIREIMSELELHETLWEPALSSNERPESVLTVTDSEIKVEKYLTFEQMQKKEEQEKEELQRRLGAKGDNVRDRALKDMMDEDKNVNILSMEVPQPEFMEKPELQWTEEERRCYKEYERNVKELAEEQEKYRVSLIAKMNKLQTSIKDDAQAFDELVRKLYERKVKSEMVLYQEQLKISSLQLSLLIVEEMQNTEEELMYMVRQAQNNKNEIGKVLNNYRHELEVIKQSYEDAVTEDKLLDSGFGKEFQDVPKRVVTQLYRLYKRRPKIHSLKKETDITKDSSVSSYAAATEGFLQMMKAMEVLDAPQNALEDVDQGVWERFCLARRTKVKSEHNVKMKALTLTGMQAFLEKKTTEKENAQIDVHNLIENMNCLREDKSRFCQDVMVQILLKYGQVEVETGDFSPCYSDSLLLHCGVVEELNKTIKALGEQKVTTMVKRKDIRKTIIQQEWEYKRLDMLIEDLQHKSRDIQMIPLSKEFQEFLKDPNDNKTAAKIAALEKTESVQARIHKKNIESHKNLLEEMKNQLELKKESNSVLNLQLIDMKVAVDERKKIYEAIAMEDDRDHDANQQTQCMLKRKKLDSIVKAQEEDLFNLRAEVEQLRKKTFPALPTAK